LIDKKISNMTQKQDDTMRVWQPIINNVGVPIIIALCSVILWTWTQYIEEFRAWRKDVEIQLHQQDVQMQVVKALVGKFNSEDK